MTLPALERAKRATVRLKDLVDLAEFAEVRRRAPDRTSAHSSHAGVPE
jgi:hypothetical protein